MTAPFTTFTTLVRADQLLAVMSTDAATPVVIDVGFDLANIEAGAASWRDAHLPGSHYLHLERDLSGAKTGPDGKFRGRHPLPSRADFAATVGRAGVAADSQVVALDRQGGMYASRLWWMLRWLGHEAVAVLDGGLDAWRAAGGALVQDAPEVHAQPPYPERAPLASIVDAAGVAAGTGKLWVVDARAGERYRGESEPLDAAAGHIPGALNRCFKDNLSADGRFKPAEQLQAEFAALLGQRSIDRIVHQCGSGVTACHNLLAMEHAGLTGSALYPGSWSEWSSDPARPVARG